MAGDIASAYVRLRPDTTGFKQEANKQVADSLKGVKRTVASALGGAGVFEVLKSTFEAAAGKQSAARQIELTVKNAGAAWTVYGKTVEQILDSQETKTGFDFEEQAQALGRLEQQIKNTPKALALLSTAEDISRARGIGLAQVSVALSRAYAGNTQSLSRLGIVLPKYTKQQDLVKSALLDVKAAEEAKAQSQAKNYEGTRKLTAAQQDLAKESVVQLKQREADLKAQLTAAAADDKRAGSTAALAEVTKRYAGQTEGYLNTASGSLAQFHVSLQQLQETLGTAFLPLLTEGAHTVGRWALELSQSQSVQDGAAHAAHEVGAAIGSIADAIRTALPLVHLLQGVLDTVGPGPILATITAYKLIPAILARVVAAEAAVSGEQAAIEAGFAGVSTSLAGLQEELAGFAAQVTATLAPEAELAGEASGVAAALTEQTAATAALTGVQQTLFAAEEEVAGAQLELLTQGELLAASNTQVAATWAEIELAATLATNAEIRAAAGTATVAEANAAVAVSAEAAAAAEAGMTLAAGPLIAAAALLAGGIYYLSTRQSEASKITSDLTKQLGALAQARKDAATAAAAEKTDDSQIPALKRARVQALDDIATAQARYDTAAGSGHASRKELADDAKAIADAQARWRDTNKQVASTEQNKRDAVKDSAKALQDQQVALENAAGDLEKLKAQTFHVALGARGGDGAKQAILDAQDYANRVRKARDANNDLSQAEKDRYTALAGFVEGIKRAPTDKEITLYLNTNPALDAWKALKSTIQDVLTTDAGPGSRGDHATTVVLHGGEAELKKNAKKAAVTYSQEFVSHIDVGGIADAITSAISDARGNISTQSSALADAVGSALDERLRRTTLPLLAEIKSLQGSLDAESAANSAKDAAQAVTDAQAKLAQLQSVYGSGSLTAGQSGEIAAAQQAVATAQQQVADAAKQARIKSLQDEVDAAGKSEDLRKTATTRSLADLADEFNRGKITQAKYLAGVRKVLAGQQVSFKSAGALLGSAFADGFTDSLKNLRAQVLLLSPAQRGSSTLTKPTSVTKAGGDAIQSVLDQIAQSGGKFTLDNVGKLPKGINVAGLVAAAKAQRAEESYRAATTKGQQTGLQYAQETNRHLEVIAGLLKDGTHVTVTGDGKATKKTRATAKATNQ